MLTVTASWWHASRIRQLVTDNGFPERIETGCFMALQEDRDDWQAGSSRLMDLYQGVIWPESTRHGIPDFPPILADNTVYMFARCSASNQTVSGLVLGPVPESAYRTHLLTFRGETTEHPN